MRPRFPNERPSISLTAAVAGKTYNLNNRTTILLEGYDLGLAPTARLSQRSPGQLGVTDLGGITAARFIDLNWLIVGNSLEDFRDLRELFMVVFRNRETAVTLTFDFGDGRVRSTDVFLDGELNFGERQLTQQVVSGVFRAADPRLYINELVVVEFAILDSTGGLPIPFTIPIPIGQDALNTTVNIFYADGSEIASVEYPIIIINGPIDNPVINNYSTNEQIELTANGGLSLAVGEFVTVDLSGFPRRDSKTIRDQDGNTAAQYLSTASDLGTWHLAFNGELLFDDTFSDGNNLIGVIGDNVTLATNVILRYFDRVEGV